MRRVELLAKTFRRAKQFDTVITAIRKKNVAVYSAFYGRHPPTRRSKTANITKDDITLQHIAKMSLLTL